MVNCGTAQSRYHKTMRNGIAISLIGTGIEAIGILLDITHHLKIGIETPEGLITPYHLIIFVGFLINFAGVLLTRIAVLRRQFKMKSSRWISKR